VLLRAIVEIDCDLSVACVAFYQGYNMLLVIMSYYSSVGAL